jgi:diacylglycerol kinase family enzyme
MPRLLLIANPSASGFTGAIHRAVRTRLAEAYDCAAAWPGSAQEARRMAADAAHDGVDVVVAMGGDGVAHHVANGLAGSSSALGLIPVGTTNVFARILGIPLRSSKAANLLAGHPAPQPVPLASVRYETGEGLFTDHAMFAVGTGLDADLVAEAERRPHGKLHFGGLYYLRTAIGLVGADFRSRPANLRVETEGRQADAVAAMAQLHWPYSYFGPKALRFTPAPEDGDELSVLVLERLGFRNGAGLFGRALLNRPLDRTPGAAVWNGVGKVVVEADPPATLQADGEVLGQVLGVEIAPAAESLLVMRPGGS